MIQPVDLREALKNKIRTNSNMIPTLLPYIQQQLLAQDLESKKEKAETSKQRTTDSSPSSRSVEKKQRQMASIKETESKSEKWKQGFQACYKCME